MGRIDHVLTGDQAGADMQRVEEVLKRLPLRHVVMNPGDVVLFDSNLLHRSDQNHSDVPRWSMACWYNAARNDPYKDSQHPRYTRLHRVLDSETSDAWVLDATNQSANILKISRL